MCQLCPGHIPFVIANPHNGGYYGARFPGEDPETQVQTLTRRSSLEVAELALNPRAPEHTPFPLP